MEKRLFPREHDLLKLCDEFEHQDGTVRIHYCPEELGKVDENLLKRLKTLPIWPSLKHHCNLGFYRTHWDHKCSQYPDRSGGVGIHDLFLTLADTRASAISRRLRIRVKNKIADKKKYGCFYHTVRIWKEGREDQPGDKPHVYRILEELSTGRPPDEIYEEYLNDMRDRAEDSLRFPFSSLDLHNRLVEKWYRFFVDNWNYFVTEPVAGFKSASEASRWLYGITTKKKKENGRVRKPIVFCRLKVKVNENLARINDVTLIDEVPKIVADLGEGAIAFAQPLYELGDELVLVRAFDRHEHQAENEQSFYSERAQAEIEQEIARYLGKRTNYEIEANLAVTYLGNKEFLQNFEKLFGPYSFSFGPHLDNEIRPAEGSEAKYAILCELCQKAQATHAFRKFLDEEEYVTEHLCEECHGLRAKQREGKLEPKSSGAKIAWWEREFERAQRGEIQEIPPSYLSYLKVDLDYQQLLEVLKQRFIDEGFYPRKKPKSEQDLGFSVVFEFLDQYERFLENLMSQVVQAYGGDDNAFRLLPNLYGFRISTPAEIKLMLQAFVEGYEQYFPKFSGYSSPIRASCTVSRFKYPFVEAWRYLNQSKDRPLNIYWVGHFGQAMSLENYKALTELNFRDQRISSSLHNLHEIETRSGLRSLVEMEIWNNRNRLREIYERIRPSRRLFTAEQLLNWYRLGEVKQQERTRIAS